MENGGQTGPKEVLHDKPKESSSEGRGSEGDKEMVRTGPRE